MGGKHPHVGEGLIPVVQQREDVHGRAHDAGATGAVRYQGGHVLAAVLAGRTGVGPQLVQAVAAESVTVVGTSGRLADGEVGQREVTPGGVERVEGLEREGGRHG